MSCLYGSRGFHSNYVSAPSLPASPGTSRLLKFNNNNNNNKCKFRRLMYSFAAGSSGLLLNTLIGNFLSLVFFFFFTDHTYLDMGVNPFPRTRFVFPHYFILRLFFPSPNAVTRVNILRKTRLHCIQKFSSCLKESNAFPLQSPNC